MKKSEFTKQIKEEILSNLSEKKKKKSEEEVPEETATDETDIELPAIEGEPSSEGGDEFNVDPKISNIQKALKASYDGAKELGDEKLSTQIGNTITYFTRAHVVNKETGVAEGLKNTIKEIVRKNLK
jgi:molecular chaperone GrpE (heat shock protein)